MRVYLQRKKIETFKTKYAPVSASDPAPILQLTVFKIKQTIYNGNQPAELGIGV